MAACTLTGAVFAVELLNMAKGVRAMKCVAFAVTSVVGVICVAALAAGTAAAAIPPAGVHCAGMTCTNSTAAPQVVNGTAVCATGIALPVNVMLEPFTTRMINATCANGAQPLGLSF
ncbi:hypothetical protein [Nocardia sp. NPDC050793]|uniref:hypothetical protein n=1 Tax=Nocardia sp. NPDC050793 TaxID=3155159 RepID=UPI0033D3869A